MNVKILMTCSVLSLTPPLAPPLPLPQITDPAPPHPSAQQAHLPGDVAQEEGPTLLTTQVSLLPPSPPPLHVQHTTATGEWIWEDIQRAEETVSEEGREGRGGEGRGRREEGGGKGLRVLEKEGTQC